MSIRQKTLLVLSLSCFVLIVTLYISAFAILGSNTAVAERREVKQNINLMLKMINKDIDSLNSICSDWAQWDDTFQFMSDKNEQYIESNILDSTFINLRLNTMIFVDSSDNVFFKRGYDLDNGMIGEYTYHLQDYISPDSFLVKHPNVDCMVSGIVVLDRGPMLISSLPITTSDKKSSIKGTLIIGRFLDSLCLRDIENLTGSNILLKTFKDGEGYLKYQDIIESSPDSNDGIAYKVTNEDFIAGYVKIKDFTGNDAMIARVEIPRVLYKQGFKTFTVLTLAFIICAALFILIAMFITQRFILSRLHRLTGFLDSLNLKEDISKRITIKGKDEISRLAGTVNRMLEKICRMNEKIITSEERLNLVLEGSTDGYWDLDVFAKRILFSPRALSILGLSDASPLMDFASVEKLFNDEDMKSTNSAFRENLKGNKKFFWVEQRVKESSGQCKWILLRGKVVERNEKGMALRMTGTITDVTDQKKAEEEIKYLSFYDTLTGLHNRAYFEDRLKALDIDRYFPLSIIMGDVNGLKLANDTFGHKEGDELLIKIAQILKKSCRESDTAARIGGDEFVIVLPNTSHDEAMSVCERIRKYCEESEGGIVKPNIALGIATKITPHESISKVLEVAESRMYKNKLIQDKSARHSIIASMQRALFETDYETEGHAKRLKNMAFRLGCALNLPSNQIDELSLLATLHDIGKIAIPKQILNKPGKLSPEEWEEIKKHPEIGYRIAIASKELATIANAILAHHEKWDGSGYPKGLKGESIPFIARIISIIDAYDVMTHKMPYKKAFSKQEALEDLKRRSGTDFDPELLEKFITLISSSKNDDEVCA